MKEFRMTMDFFLFLCFDTNEYTFFFKQILFYFKSYGQEYVSHDT